MYPSRLQNSLPSSRIAVLETTTFLEFNLLSENLLRINRLPSSLSLFPRLFPSRRRRVFPQFSPIQWNYVDCDAPCSLEKGGEFTIEAEFNKSTVGEGRVGDYSKRLRIWFDT